MLSLSNEFIESINVSRNIVAGSIAALQVGGLILCDEILQTSGHSLLGCLNLVVAYGTEEPYVHTELLCLGSSAPDVESAVYTLLGAVVAGGERVNIGIAVELEGKLTRHTCGLKYLGGSGLSRGGDGSAIRTGTLIDEGLVGKVLYEPVAIVVLLKVVVLAGVAVIIVLPLYKSAIIEESKHLLLVDDGGGSFA